MEALNDEEIIAADTVSSVEPETKMRSTRTRMRTGISNTFDLNPETDLNRQEIRRILRRQSEEA